MLGQEGWRDHHERVERAYRELGLSLCDERPPRNESAPRGERRQMVSAINEIWSMDLVAENPLDGRRLRTPTIVVRGTRQYPAIEVDASLRGEYVVAALARRSRQRPLPRYVKTDSGSEFISKTLDKRAYENGVAIDFSRLGKPADNEKNEFVNGRFREVCLNAHWFLSLADARRKTEVWREYYNEARPHSALQWMTPTQYARQRAIRADSAHP